MDRQLTLIRVTVVCIVRVGRSRCCGYMLDEVRTDERGTMRMLIVDCD